jgi:hypothetical protein
MVAKRMGVQSPSPRREAMHLGDPIQPTVKPVPAVVSSDRRYLLLSQRSEKNSEIMVAKHYGQQRNGFA